MNSHFFARSPQELGTLPQEDPGIQITKSPSTIVFPDKDMIFELELINLGVGDESNFNLSPDLNNDEGNLAITVDGEVGVKKEESIKKTLTVSKGPRMFINKAST